MIKSFITFIMIISFILAIPAKAECPKTKIVNVSKFEWNEVDNKNLEIAKKRCGEIFKGSACVKLFKKYNFQQYSVICGAEE